MKGEEWPTQVLLWRWWFFHTCNPLLYPLTPRNMNSERRTLIFILLAATGSWLGITGCTKRVYGVAEEHWLHMTQPQRLEAIRGYNERKLIEDERRLVEERRAAEESKRQRIQAELEAERTHKRVQAIYAGEEGFFGDLIRVTVSGGTIRFNGNHRSYQPLSFKLADGERKQVTFHSEGEHQNTLEVWVMYRDGNLVFDARNKGRYAKRFAFEPEWRRGKKYQNISLRGSSRSEAKNISITVLTVEFNRKHRYLR